MDGAVKVSLPDGREYFIVPFLKALVGQTKNIGFRVYGQDPEEGLIRHFQFDDMEDLDSWFNSVVIDGTMDTEPEK